MATIEAAMQKARTAQPSACEMLFSVKVRELAEDVEARIDFGARELLQALRAEALAGKGAHDAAVEHGVAPGGGRELGLRGEIAEEAAGKAVARAGGIDDLLEREGRSLECAQLRFLALWMEILWNNVAPYSPCLTTRMRGPRAMTARAA